MSFHYSALVCAMLFAVTPLPCAEEQTPSDVPITVALAGDMIGPFHPMNLSSDVEFAKVAELFLHADAGFANQEGAIFDLNHFAGYPAAETGGGYPVQVAATARDIKDMGISLVSKANNHATDYGAEGLMETLGNLSGAGIVAGGAGRSDSEARRPVYLTTPKGTVALVATASTFPPASVAGPAVVRQNTTSRPRPGINPLHVREVRVLPPAAFASVREAAGPLATEEGSAIRISDQVFRLGASFGMQWEMDPSNEKTILDAVDEAKAHASLVLFSIHAHETAGDEDKPGPVPFQPMVLHKADEAPSADDPQPAAFEVALFHAAVDHGADIVIRHGPHVIGGIEIYKGKPIFYSLASLFLDFGGRKVIETPGGEKLSVPDAWYEGVTPVCEFSSHQLRTVKLYPITIERQAGGRSGLPSVARGERAEAILRKMAERSAAFGTKIEISDGVGVVRIGSR